MTTPDPKSQEIWHQLRASEAMHPPSTFGFESRVMASLRQQREPSFWELAFKLSPLSLMLIVLAAFALPSQIHDLEELVSFDTSLDPLPGLFHD